jgi:hypothetical protein
MDNKTHTIGRGTTTATSVVNTKATTFMNLRSTAGTVTFTALWECETGYYDNGVACVKDILLEATSTAANQTLKINKYFANAYTVDR